MNYSKLYEEYLKVVYRFFEPCETCLNPKIVVSAWEMLREPDCFQCPQLREISNTLLEAYSIMRFAENDVPEDRKLVIEALKDRVCKHKFFRVALEYLEDLEYGVYVEGTG